MMNLRDLKYLVAVVELGHFGKAAAACFISQPALSMQIKKLEEVLGIQLLERTNKSVLLTNVGRTIYERAKNMMVYEKEIYELAKHAQDPFSGELHMGVIPTVAPYLLPHIMPELKQSFPNLTVYLTELQTLPLLEKLKQGKLDVGLLALPIAEPELVTESLFEEEFMLAVPANHRLAKRKYVKPTDLQNLTMLLLEDGHCLREQALTICHSNKAAEAKSFQATSLETLRHMIAAQVGITLMPKLACKLNDSISYIPFSPPKPTRAIGLVWRMSSAKKMLLDNLNKQLAKLVAKSNKMI